MNGILQMKKWIAYRESLMKRKRHAILEKEMFVGK